jgi:CrcB protein
MIFLGSGLGGACRWALSSWLNGQHPYGTLICNLLGCFLLGLLTKLSPGDTQTKLLLTTGFCGGFTTFSTFMNESNMLLKNEQFAYMALYIAGSVLIGFVAVIAGNHISKML